jgi:hypothetical protein
MAEEIQVENFLQAIAQRAGALADSSDAKNLAYLAKSYEYLYGKEGASEKILDEMIDKISGIQTESQSLRDALEKSFSLGAEWPEKVTSITIDNGGTCYTSGPTITFSGGNPIRPAQALITNFNSGTISAISITDPGAGYQSTPTATVVGDGTGATLTVNITSEGHSIWDALQRNRRQARAPFRWVNFRTHPAYDTSNSNGGWVMANNSSMFGGVALSNWSDSNFRATHMAWNDAEKMRTIFTRKGHAHENAMIFSEVWNYYSGSTDGMVGLAFFRVKNLTYADITWTPSFYYTCYNSHGERAGIAINGTELWSASSDVSGSATASPGLTIPADITSTVIFSVTSNAPSSEMRGLQLGFYGDSLILPEGLEFVDDLDSDTYPN